MLDVAKRVWPGFMWDGGSGSERDTFQKERSNLAETHEQQSGIQSGYASVF